MRLIFKRWRRTSQQHPEGCHVRTFESKPLYHTQSSQGLSSCCKDLCCARCASTIEKSINEYVQFLVAGRDLAQKMHEFGLADRLLCVPLTESGYRFLKYQFRIVDDYLAEKDASGNRWGAVFHLRLIGARIRTARVSSTNFAGNFEEARSLDSDCCGR